jgi:hypothetical protein
MKLDSWSSHYAIREKRNLEKDLFPFLGARHIGDIEAIELLATVRRVEERGALDVAHRVLTTAGQVWRYAVATGRAPRDVTADIRGALKPHHGKHFAAITDPGKAWRTDPGDPWLSGRADCPGGAAIGTDAVSATRRTAAAAWAEFDLGRGAVDYSGGTHEAQR